MRRQLDGLAAGGGGGRALAERPGDLRPLRLPVSRLWRQTFPIDLGAAAYGPRGQALLAGGGVRLRRGMRPADAGFLEQVYRGPRAGPGPSPGRPGGGAGSGRRARAAAGAPEILPASIPGGEPVGYSLHGTASDHADFLAAGTVTLQELAAVTPESYAAL